MDSSMAAKSAGLGAAFCLLCPATVEDCMNPDVVQHGFKITRSIESVWAKYNELVESGGIKPGNKRFKADVKEREGITRAPLIRGYVDPIQYIFPLHCVLNSLKYKENFIVTFNSRSAWPDNKPYRRQFEELTQAQKDMLKEKRMDMRRRAQDPNGLALVLDMADRSGSQVRKPLFLGLCFNISYNKYAFSKNLNILRGEMCLKIKIFR